MKRRSRPLALLLASVAALFVLPACTTVQETGRHQLMLTSPDSEAAEGMAAFAQMKKEEKISTDPALNARIQRIGKRIAGAVGRDLPNAQWEFVVFDAPDTINAFALPGGKVGVYTGLINLAGASDDEIAIVMGHEVAHVTSRHGGERQSQAMIVAAGAAALSVGTQESKNSQLYMLAYGGASTLGTLAFSRSHESEADSIGLRFAAKAGYDPRAAVTFWTKMAAKEKGASVPPKWLSTHPPSQERIENLKRLAPGLMPTYEQARANFARTGSPVAPAASSPKSASGGEQAELDKFLGR